MYDINILLSEQQKLRGELQTLKDCQVRYFWSSIIATGTIMGLGSRLGQQETTVLFYLAPIMIVLPCWLIFFDKATTITRIVGYYRILEFLILFPKDQSYVYLGWENSLRLFREKQKEKDKGIAFFRRFLKYVKDTAIGIWILLTFRSTHRYWNLNWITFFIISILSLYLGYTLARIQYSLLLLVFSILVLIASIHNLYLLKNLIIGKFSYDENEAFWKEILSSREARSFFNNKKCM